MTRTASPCSCRQPDAAISSATAAGWDEDAEAIDVELQANGDEVTLQSFLDDFHGCVGPRAMSPPDPEGPKSFQMPSFHP